MTGALVPGFGAIVTLTGLCVYPAEVEIEVELIFVDEVTRMDGEFVDTLVTGTLEIVVAPDVNVDVVVEFNCELLGAIGAVVVPLLLIVLLLLLLLLVLLSLFTKSLGGNTIVSSDGMYESVLLLWR